MGGRIVSHLRRHLGLQPLDPAEIESTLAALPALPAPTARVQQGLAHFRRRSADVGRPAAVPADIEAKARAHFARGTTTAQVVAVLMVLNGRRALGR